MKEIQLENGAVIEEFDSAMRGDFHEHTAVSKSQSSAVEIKAIY